jgi:hypothetical protein
MLQEQQSDENAREAEQRLRAARRKQRSHGVSSL